MQRRCDEAPLALTILYDDVKWKVLDSTQLDNYKKEITIYDLREFTDAFGKMHDYLHGKSLHSDKGRVVSKITISHVYSQNQSQ